MFFLNLSAVEFAALFGLLGSLITSLYLLDRTRRKRLVSTLRFWTPGVAARQDRRRRRVQEPWSLVLQLASLLLLLLALAQVQFGSRVRSGRDHVVLLDTSAWSAQRRGSRTLLDDEKQAAGQYLSAIPARDRVLLVAADALATPLTPFTSDRGSLRTALRAAHSSFSSLNLQQALLFARRARNGAENDSGEVVYIGPGMMTRNDVPLPRIPSLRVVWVAAEREHAGIRGVSIQRSATNESEWQASVTVQNYGALPSRVPLRVRSGPEYVRRVVSLGAGEQASAEFSFAANTAGEFVADIDAGSDVEGDHHVALDLPPIAKARVDVVTSRADKLRPLFPVNGQLEVRFLAPAQYSANAAADLIVLDQTAGAVPTARAAIWIDPPRDRAPWPVKAVIDDARITAWHSETPLAAGLRTRQTHLGRASVFQAFEPDTVVASTAGGPVVIARDAGGDRGKWAVIGFDPLNGRTRFEITTPLLFANLLRWSLPDVFHALDVNAERIGTIVIPLEPGHRGDDIRILDRQGVASPFIATRKSIELFVSRPQMLRVVAGGRQRTLSVLLPDIAAFGWTPPASSAIGLPTPSRLTSGAVDLWRALAVLGVVGLFAEWTLFGRRRKLKRQLRDTEPHATRGSRERELVGR
jgi:von Willebrand factor type A domain/Aerotolerance regulator N-terminal